MIREANMHWQYVDTECGLIMPWYTLPCLQWLKEQETYKWVVFEYGCGYSTIWFRLNCLKIISVDHNAQWAKAMSAEHVEDKKEYIEAPYFYTLPLGAHFNPNFIDEREDKNLFDCIIIDGEHRKECLEFSIACVNIGGYIIIDNWGQEDFPDTEFAEKLLEGWEKTIFKQPNHSSWQTAVFRKI